MIYVHLYTSQSESNPLKFRLFKFQRVIQCYMQCKTVVCVDKLKKLFKVRVCRSKPINLLNIYGQFMPECDFKTFGQTHMFSLFYCHCFFGKKSFKGHGLYPEIEPYLNLLQNSSLLFPLSHFSRYYKHMVYLY